MKIKNKGKVHPSPSSAAAAAASDGVILSVLQLLPAAIIALATVLSAEDREVLAYLITHSINTTPNFSSIPQEPTKKKSLKKSSNKSSSASAAAAGGAHQAPMFDCGCFDCYLSYWSKWDESPNRQLIHQAIEAFEDQMAGEKPKKNAGRGKRRDKQLGRREPPPKTAQDAIFMEQSAVPELTESSADLLPENEVMAQDAIFMEQSAVPELAESSADLLPENEVFSVSSPEKNDGFEANDVKVEDFVEGMKLEPPQTADDVAVIVQATAASNHRGLARKVLPDVLGLLNSRLWNLWGPNV